MIRTQTINTFSINRKIYYVFKHSQIHLSSIHNNKYLIQMHFFNYSNNKIQKQKAYQIQNLRVSSTNQHLIQLTFQNSSTLKIRGT
jgi:hypothetical protein